MYGEEMKFYRLNLNFVVSKLSIMNRIFPLIKDKKAHFSNKLSNIIFFFEN